MTDEEQKRIFANNLKRYISLNQKQQIDVAKDLGINPTTFNMWCKGNSMPSTGKIRKLADYFRIGMSDLTDEKHKENIDVEYSDITMEIGISDDRFKKIIMSRSYSIYIHYLILDHSPTLYYFCLLIHLIIYVLPLYYKL